MSTHVGLRILGFRVRTVALGVSGFVVKVLSCIVVCRALQIFVVLFGFKVSGFKAKRLSRYRGLIEISTREGSLNPKCTANSKLSSTAGNLYLCVHFVYNPI